MGLSVERSQLSPVVVDRVLGKRRVLRKHEVIPTYFDYDEEGVGDRFERLLDAFPA